MRSKKGGHGILTKDSKQDRNNLHVLIEELLQLLVDVIDADLLKAVVVEDLETSNVEDADVGHLLHRWVAKSLIT